MDEYLEKATEFGDGIRILKQDGMGNAYIVYNIVK